MVQYAHVLVLRCASTFPIIFKTSLLCCWLHASVARCTGTRKVPRYPYVKNDTILHSFGTGTSLKKHAIRTHSLFRSLSGCLHALTARCKYFGYEADTEGKPIDTHRPFKFTQAKGGDTSNMANHLSDRHPELFREFKERQVSKCDYKHEHPSSPTYSLTRVALA